MAGCQNRGNLEALSIVFDLASGPSIRLFRVAAGRGEEFMSARTESGLVPPALAAVPVPPPVGSAFALGWLMAELFDSRRRESPAVRQPPFSKAVQLPLVGDLDDAELLNFLLAGLHDLLAAYPDVSDARVRAEAARKQPASAEPFDQAGFDREVRELHLAILNRLAEDQQQLNAYQLGIALSDMCWLPAADGPDSLIGMFKRGQAAAMQTWLNGAGSAIPPSTAAIVGQSLSHWADWVDVNAAQIRAAGAANADGVISALRVQGAVWHSVLTADPDVSLDPGMGAWVQAGSAIARAARLLSASIIRRFWPAVLVAAATLAGLLYLVIANLSGAGQVWASLVTVAAVVGCGGAGLGSGVSRSFSGVGYEIWNAAKLEAQAWNITWLPSMPQGAMRRVRLENRGVAVPRIRRNVDAA
jgi:hypothetical protein